MALKVAINGFGRIGRLVVRAAVARKSPIEFVHVNDLTDANTLQHLLKFDTVHRVWHGIPSQSADGRLHLGSAAVPVTAEKDPSKLPWGALGVDIVLEATGRFTDREKAAVHLAAGAKSVLVSAPSKGAELTFVMGVNDSLYDRSKHRIFSIGSCTTNCLAPVAKVLNDTFGIEHGFMTTIHAYTNDQNILDLPHKDLRRARAAGMNMIPTSTGAAKAIGEVLPELKGRLDGLAVRVPVQDGSLVDLVVKVKKTTTKEEVNAAMKAASQGALKGYLEYCEDPIVSNDVIGNAASSVFDSLSTNVMNGDLVKVMSWYDNEWGFSNRVVDALLKMA
ncbi:MAG: type I glyceraldehyde-3-phosphate dehydrogenase [Candidatus Eisenbacteria bacterium]|nr:type I glyceraldehyde-3-phosphate dehydrogenase [Candidatus Eisenbacteria bacterium]